MGKNRCERFRRVVKCELIKTSGDSSHTHKHTHSTSTNVHVRVKKTPLVYCWILSLSLPFLKGVDVCVSVCYLCVHLGPEHLWRTYVNHTHPGDRVASPSFPCLQNRWVHITLLQLLPQPVNPRVVCDTCMWVCTCEPGSWAGSKLSWALETLCVGVLQFVVSSHTLNQGHLSTIKS